MDPYQQQPLRSIRYPTPGQLPPGVVRNGNSFSQGLRVPDPIPVGQTIEGHPALPTPESRAAMPQPQVIEGAPASVQMNQARSATPTVAPSVAPIAPARAFDANSSSGARVQPGGVFRKALDASADVMRSAGRGVANAGIAALPAAVGYAGAKAIHSLTGADKPLASGPLDLNAPQPAGAIPIDHTLKGPATQPENQPFGLGGDNDFTRNMANTLMAVPGLAGVSKAVGALRVGSNAARVVNVARAAGATVGGAMAANPAFAGPPSSPPGLPPQPPNPLDRRLADGSAAAPSEAVATPVVSDSANPGLRNVLAGPHMSATHEDVLQAARAADTFGLGAHNADGTGGMTGVNSTVEGNFRGASNQASYDAARRQHLLEQGLGSSDRGVRAASVQGLAQGAETGAAERVASLRERGETARANALNATNRSIHTNANAVSIRGQDTALAGHRMANDVARANMQREQYNADRTFSAGRTDAANAQDTKHAERREASAKALPDELAGMLPPGADGKPDLANGARHAQAMTNAVADLATNTTDPALKARLVRDGVGALDQSDKRRLLAGVQLADVARASATNGLTPWGTREIKSNAPVMAIKKLPNGDYQTNRRGVNGETEIIPARFIEKEGSTLGVGGQASDKFKALIEKQE